MFDYKKSKTDINEILKSKTDIEKRETIPQNISEFTFDNGIKSWVGALFVDMRNSTEYFKSNKQDIVARVLRAFCSEVIGILGKNKNVREIGIRGDCVYAIYSAPYRDDLNDILNDAIIINTFNDMFQKILEQNNYPQFSIGIGLGAGEDLVVKAGKKFSGYNAYIWIGKAVVEASNLSNIGDSRNGDSIYMSKLFYENVKEFVANSDENKLNSDFYRKKYIEELGEVYSGNVVKSTMSEWINKGMPD